MENGINFRPELIINVQENMIVQSAKGIQIQIGRGACRGFAVLLYGALLLSTLDASAANVSGTHDFECLIESEQFIEIRSSVTGLLESVPVRRGDTVKKGMVVAVLESGVERAVESIAKYRSQSSGAIESATARTELLGKKSERRNSMAAERAISAQDRDDAELERRIAQADLRQAYENRDQAKLEWQQATEQLRRRSLRSPFDGIVFDQYVFPGELVDPTTSSKPILKLAKVDPLRVDIILPLTQFGKIKRGDPVEIIPEAPVGGRYISKVSLVDRIVDAKSGTFGVRLELRNPNFQLPPGIKCKARFGG